MKYVNVYFFLFYMWMIHVVRRESCIGVGYRKQRSQLTERLISTIRVCIPLLYTQRNESMSELAM